MIVIKSWHVERGLPLFCQVSPATPVSAMWSGITLIMAVRDLPGAYRVDCEGDLRVVHHICCSSVRQSKNKNYDAIIPDRNDIQECTNAYVTHRVGVPLKCVYSRMTSFPSPDEIQEGPLKLSAAHWDHE